MLLFIDSAFCVGQILKCILIIYSGKVLNNVDGSFTDWSRSNFSKKDFIKIVQIFIYFRKTKTGSFSFL